MMVKKTVPSYFNRYITVLYYLNDVEGGGETAFPVADNKTFEHEVRYLGSFGTWYKNLRTDKEKSFF